MPALSPRAQQKPFTQEQVSNMVRDGFGDESGVKLIGQRGIDFTPSEDFYQTLKAAGASEAFLNALRAAKPPEPASAKKPINQVQVFVLIAAQIPSHRVAMLIHERGIDFDPTDDYLHEVRLAGGEDELISALQSAKVTRPESVGPAVQARQTEVRQHVARAGEFYRDKRYADAEAEVRAALRLAPDNPELHDDLAGLLGDRGDWDGEMAEEREALRLKPDDEIALVNLGMVLGVKGDWDGDIAEEREALRLNPNDSRAHVNLGVALGGKHDLDGEIAEEREALRLEPTNDTAHVNLSAVLGERGDLDGAVAEAREGLRLNPNNVMAHTNLAHALGGKHDWDGQIAEEREVLRLDPNNEMAHVNLGVALGVKGDWEGEIAEESRALRLKPDDEKAHVNVGLALGAETDWDRASAEFREALRLNPKNESAHASLGIVLGVKGDTDGEIAEEREALSLNPSDGFAHGNLGHALGVKGDWDGAIAEYREALRLSPSNALAHAGLGGALEKRGDDAGALEEYRSAYMLDPKNAQFKQAYERLLQPSPPSAEPTPTNISGKQREWREGIVTKITSEAPGATPPPAETVFRYQIQRWYYWVTTGNTTYILVNSWSVGFHAPKAPLNVTLNGRVKIAIDGKDAYIIDNSGKQIKRPVVTQIATAPAP
jgi:Flp pilus assembly protein TadD